MLPTNACPYANLANQQKPQGIINLYALYKKLLKKHGQQGWWPTRKTGYHNSNKTRKLSEKEMLEICIGAILTQNTSWKNAEKALNNLFEAKLASLQRIASTRHALLAKAIKPSGYYNQKAERLQSFARHVMHKHGSFTKMFRKELPQLRKELLTIKGIGPETADSMLLYAGRKPVFVVDTYTKRLCAKNGINCGDYHTLQAMFHKQLPQNHKIYNEFHAVIVAEGKKKNKC
jgi:endonuclease-3 related protein